jgi:hypothetical protein
LGEFYGPAVIHAQDSGQVKKELDKIVHTNPDVKILIYPGNVVEQKDKGFVYFSEREPNECYDFAFAEWLYLNHWRIPESNLYKEYLSEQYAEFYTHYFPLKIWMYKIYKRKQPCPS